MNQLHQLQFQIKMNDKIIEIINCGFLYGHGRDHRYRPVLVINAKVYKKFKDTYSTEEWVIAVMYFIEYCISRLTIPGQVENWNIICDVDEVSVIFLPGDLKKIIEILQCNYRARLYVLFLLNMSFGVRMVWNMIKGMLDPNTEKKIKMIGSDKTPMFELINKNQIEKKFGGSAENVEKHYFPHIMPDDKVLDEKEDKKKLLMEEGEYCEFIEKNPQYIPSPYIEWEKKKIVFEHQEADDISVTTKAMSLSSKDSGSSSSKGVDEGFSISNENVGNGEIKNNIKKMNNHKKKPSIDFDKNNNK